MSFNGRDIISIKNLTRDEIEYILDIALKMKKHYDEPTDLLKGKILTTLFYEPSTRTRLSFTSAMLKLGGEVMGFSDPKASSAAKGENLSDSILCIESYSDVIVIRHKLEGSARLAAEVSKNPIINAGSGTQEHPTQALLDLLTIRNEFKSIDGLKIGMVGDLKYGRTVKSLSYALSLYDVELSFISPPMLTMRKEVLKSLDDAGIKYEEQSDLSSVLPSLDVIYVTRIQKERFPDPADYEKVRGSYKINKDFLKEAKNSMILMHPLPRVDEIAFDVDALPCSRYFIQPLNGVLIRMALLALVLGKI
ncbi:MAG: aspartate carbamoyltransferase [Candidatus Helarchaeota archaeon]|nr:aspartate carbamoyltransferase [Candidatus Helarchaeota archaeon]